MFDPVDDFRTLELETELFSAMPIAFFRLNLIAVFEPGVELPGVESPGVEVQLAPMKTLKLNLLLGFPNPILFLARALTAKILPEGIFFIVHLVADFFAVHV
jgi:hypothetical protein